MKVHGISAFIVLCFVCGLVGCTEKVDSDMAVDNTVLDLRLDEVFQEKAYVRLTHDGSQEDYWYYMLTRDLTSDARTLFEQEVGKIIGEEGRLVGNVGTNRNLTFEQLDAKTAYRVIAARLLSDGSITGNVAELDFVTLRDPDVFEQHPAWSISYKERRISAEDPDEESEIIGCTVSDEESEDTYVPCLLTKKDFQEAYGGNLRKCFEDYVAFRNLENVKWPNVLRNASCEHVEDRLRHGDYILFMIGVDSEGGLTGWYAMTECTIAQETATDAYRKWVGRWTLSGTNNGNRISYSVEISPDENNLYYRMSGYESTSATDYMTGVPTELPVLLYFEKSTGDAYVVSEALGDLSDPTLADFYDFFLYGCVEIEYEGVMTSVPVDVSNLKIARFSLSGDSYASVTPEIFSFDLNGVHYDAPFIYFNYSYTSALYSGLVPVTADSAVPYISTMTLAR